MIVPLQAHLQKNKEPQVEVLRNNFPPLKNSLTFTYVNRCGLVKSGILRLTKLFVNVLERIFEYNMVQHAVVNYCHLENVVVSHDGFCDL